MMTRAIELIRCIVCDKPVIILRPEDVHYPGEGWVHRECVKDANEGKRWIKGLSITQS